MLQKTCRDFVEAELKPVAALLDKEHKFPAKQVVTVLILKVGITVKKTICHKMWHFTNNVKKDLRKA